MSVSEMDRRRLLVTAAGAAASLAAPVAARAVEAQPALGLGRNQLFDLGWKFRRGEGDGFEVPGFDDSGWRTVDLPHDWSIEDLPPEPGKTIVGPFDKSAVGGTATGFAVGGDGWYRKRFHLGRPDRGRVEVLFEGVYMASDVWLNGHHLGAHPYGYTPFAYDLTPYLAANGDNVIAVRVRNRGQNSRWYSGSGIYRHVWLDVLPWQARIARWGVGVTTRRVTEAGAEIEISTRLEDSATTVLISRIKDSAGRTLWEQATGADAEVKQTATLPQPELWSPDSPVLYTLETELKYGYAMLDRRETPFGVRIATFDAERGMMLNGKPIKLRGGCIHHDNGLLGAAAFDAAEDRKVRLLRARGYNAVRPSHNPYSPAFLRACDRHGMMVVGETFDCWRVGKLPQDYSAHFDEQWRADLTAMVLSARHHPSVIMWSIGNEIPDRNSPAGVEIQWRLANEVHKLDPSRPVTAAINNFPGQLVTPSAATARPGRGGIGDQASTVFLDVAGYNYKLREYETDHQRFPDRVLMGTESFPKDVFAIWELTERSPWLIGDFVWTAMDYLGEAGIGGSVYGSRGGLGALGAWPEVVSRCGDIDLIGDQNPASLARDVVWGLSPLEVAVQSPPPEGKKEVVRPWGWSNERQSWNWPGHEGRPLAVRIYTTGDRVEARLNGKPVAAPPVTAADLKHVEVSVPYAPGTLEVVAFRGGAEIGRRRLATTGAPAAIRLRPERPDAGSARGEVSYVAVEVIDAQARIVPDLAARLTVSISGPADLAGFGSASPFAVGSFQAATAQTWNGRALAILRGQGRPGRVRVEVRGEGLKSGIATLHMV